jgi:hypothetical protein
VSGCTTTGKTLPIVEYTHSHGGCSVTGGYVYRGTQTALQGRYFFGDYCTGYIWNVSRTTGVLTRPAWSLDTSLNITSFGEGSDGELYVVGQGGTVHRILSN